MCHVLYRCLSSDFLHFLFEPLKGASGNIPVIYREIEVVTVERVQKELLKGKKEERIRHIDIRKTNKRALGERMNERMDIKYKDTFWT